jgi:uncharacterized damage-inducible protein DinB
MDLEEHLTGYTEYNLWANTKLSEKLSTIDVGHCDAEQKSSFGSVKLTIIRFCSVNVSPSADYITYLRTHGK